MTRFDDARLGRSIAAGRFEILEWLGHSAEQGVALAIDVTTQQRVRLTFTSPSMIPLDEAVARFATSEPTLFDVVYLGEVASDDAWGTGAWVMAEAAPSNGEILGAIPPALEPIVLARRLTELLAIAHAQTEPLGTLQPENLFFTELEGVRWMGRGARLWTLAQPSSTAILSPFAIGYSAPEANPSASGLLHLAPAVDVFSLGVIVAERMLGAFPYRRDSMHALMIAQLTGQHALLPESALGALIARCLSPTPDARPSVTELSAALR